MAHHEDTEDGLRPPPLQSWSAPRREEALATLADLLASTIDDADVSSSEVRRALDAGGANEDWRSALLEVEVGKLQQTQSRQNSPASDAAQQPDIPTVLWRCPVCSSPQQVADARKLLRDRKGVAGGRRSLPSAPTCKKCGFSAQSAD